MTGLTVEETSTLQKNTNYCMEKSEMNEETSFPNTRENCYFRYGLSSAAIKEGTSLVAQTVKRLSTMQETRV